MTAGVIAAVLLGATFLVAGASKLVAREEWKAQARDLGAPSIAAPLLPWVEIVIGAALVVQFQRTLAAVAALVLLVAFTVLIAVRLAQGKRPACACFGAWSASPIGPRHLVRNGVLMVLAVLAML